MKKVQYGVFTKLMDHPAWMMMAKKIGYDIVFFDQEHGYYDENTLLNLIMLAHALDLKTWIRVNELSRKEVSKAVDLGASAVMVPMIETVEQAQQLVAYSKYPPLGQRGYAGGANTDYQGSGNHAKHMEDLNRRTLTLAQIESVQGVEQVEAIAAVDGIDGLIIGPVDLSISLGVVGNVMDAQELTAIRRVIKAAKQFNRLVGIIGSLTLIEEFKDDLDVWFAVNDLSVLRNGLSQGMEQYLHLDSTRKG